MKKQYIFIIGAIACANTIASQDYSDGNVYIYKQNSVVDGFSSFDGVDAYFSSEIDSISFIDPCEDFSIDSFKFETGFKTYGWKNNAYFDNWEEQFTKSCYQYVFTSRERMFSDTSAYVYNAQENAVYAKRTCDIMLKVYGKNVDRVQYLGDGSYSWNKYNDYRWTNDNWYDENICTRGENENGQRTLIVRLQAEIDMTKEEVTLCNSVDKVYIKGCSKPIATKALPKVYMEPVPAEYKQLCVSMCDNEFAVKTINLYGNNFLEGTGIEVYFWNEEDADYTAKATYEIQDLNHLKVYIPENAGENHPIYLKNKYNELYTDFIYRDTRNMLITHDDEEYLNKFNQDRPDKYDEEYETGLSPERKEEFKNKYFASDNSNGDFSIFTDFGSYTGWSYSPIGEANPTEEESKYPTPFGCFTESIKNGETTFNDYVIKFEVFVPEEYPMNGNGLAIGFFRSYCFEAREYCAFWQPSRVTFKKNSYGVWQEYDAYFDDWNSGGDWMTVTIPMEELRYDFMSKNYYCGAQNDRLIVDDYYYLYDGFGDKEDGLPFFEKNAKLSTLLDNRKMVRDIQGIAIVLGAYDQPNMKNSSMIAVDNLRIVPKDNNGGVWPMLKWGEPAREFNTAPVKCGKDFEEESGIKLPDCEITFRNTPVYPENPDTTPLPDPVVDKTKQTINGYEYVDLGLPSGNLWATVNVGASTPSEYGEYYAYGEIEPKKMYDENTSAVYGLSQELLSRKGVYNVKEDEYGMYEYVLSPKHDAATMNWGNGWQLPNGGDFSELTYECDWTWTTLDGVNGYVVKSRQKGNNNSIFLPAAGMKVKNGTTRDGQWGRYLTENTTLNIGVGFEDDQMRYDLSFDKKNLDRNYDGIIINGLSVRPVAKIK